MDDGSGKFLTIQVRLMVEPILMKISPVRSPSRTPNICVIGSFEDFIFLHFFLFVGLTQHSSTVFLALCNEKKGRERGKKILSIYFSLHSSFSIKTSEKSMLDGE
jgi:hypothetical protein